MCVRVHVLSREVVWRGVGWDKEGGEREEIREEEGGRGYPERLQAEPRRGKKRAGRRWGECAAPLCACVRVCVCVCVCAVPLLANSPCPCLHCAAQKNLDILLSGAGARVSMDSGKRAARFISASAKSCKAKLKGILALLGRDSAHSRLAGWPTAHALPGPGGCGTRHPVLAAPFGRAPSASASA